MKAGRGKKAVVGTVAIGVVVLAAAAFAVRDRIGGYFRRLGPREPLVARDEFANQTVELEEGQIPVIELLRFLSDYTGLPLVGDMNEIATRVIAFPSPVKNVDGEFIRAALEANGIRVDPETLPGGKRVIRITPTGGAPPPGKSATAETLPPEEP
jgi:hypothetical protein